MDYNRVISLNPDYHFKNDIDRIIMYSRKKVAQYSSSNWLGYIHPIQATILTLFTENRTLKENIELLSKHFNMSFTQTSDLISPYINNEEKFFTEFNSIPIDFPRNVLIDDSKLSEDEKVYDCDDEDFDCKEIDLIPDRTHKTPQSMLLMLTSKCATKCKYCYADKRTKYQELTTEQILKIIDNARNLKMSYIDIIGGEIFLRKDWSIILSQLVESNLMPSYISTKVPVTKDIAETLSNTGYNNVVQISLDSLDETKLKKIISCPTGYIENIKEGIELLQEYGFKLYIDTILTKHNSSKEDILSMYEYIKTIKKLVHWEIRVPEKSIYTPETFAEVKAGKQELIELCNFVRNEIMPVSAMHIIVSDEVLNNEYRKGKCSDISFKGGTCGALHNSFFVLPDGKVSICELLYWHPQFIIGDLKKQSIEEIWQSEKAKSLFLLKDEFYREESTCKSCKTLEFCTNKHRKCWVRVLRAYGEANWDFPDPQCCYAPDIPSAMLYQ